jgi:hypothetical protein
LCRQQISIASLGAPEARKDFRASVVASDLIRSRPSIMIACITPRMTPVDEISGEFARRSTSAVKAASVRKTFCISAKGTSGSAVIAMSFRATGRYGGRSLRTQDVRAGRALLRFIREIHLYDYTSAV